MNINTALAISIGLLGGVATYLFLADHFGLGLQIWAAFIAWASFFHCGGKMCDVGNNIAANIWGVIAAAVGLWVFANVGMGATLGTPLWAAICVGVAVFVMILLTQIPFLAAIPATVYGFAATAGYTLLTNGAGSLADPSLKNPAVVIALSMIVGTIFGYISGAVAGAIAKS